jgi:hypothetical protein
MANPFQAFRHLFSIAGVAFMTTSSADAGPVQPGTWSGNGAVLTTSPQQTRFDVGSGLAVIKGPLNADAKGQFKTTGMFEVYKPGAQRADDRPVMRMAHFQGRVMGPTVELTMHVEGERAMRKFVLTQGRVAKLIRPM